VPNPEEATLDPALREPLESLSERGVRLAAISGRDRRTLEPRLPRGWLVVASYGLELPIGLAPGGHPPAFQPEVSSQNLRLAEVSLRQAMSALPGARLEQKSWGLSLHFRGLAEPPDEGIVRELLAPIAQSHDLQLHPGRQVYELRPRTDVDKGWALRFLFESLEPTACVYVGDDLGDIPAWREARRLDGPVPVVGVGVASSEVPAEAMADAGVVLPGRAALVSLCEELARAASRPAAAAAG
jgi:trehalose 6-phosphate phosphatase